jgi:hypothetical protein
MSKGRLTIGQGAGLATTPDQPPQLQAEQPVPHGE